ncbi:hypothetical protein Ga0123462_1278 [Mariprofundus ferrinatatus]|uniref:Uncharacterized protein n=1 Tax=Mariprofundus ferrinatatus TaxID=1921087 RepID=A0A2K8L4V2_9PROT|nr:hypothetical protein [Mariprofundus ferrinatatus]ATX82142.1 hypothetical protein Ga0123462_1278 [Mariprofundus ferrinatatus]
MGTESLENAIEETKSELDKREPRRLIAWAVITLVIFFVPIVLFYKLASGSVFETSYAPVVIVWLMVSLGVSNVIAAALFSARTVELRLAVETATAVLKLAKSGDATTGEPDAELNKNA